MSASSRTVKVKFDGEAKGLARAAAEGERDVDRFGKNTERSMTRSGDKASRGFLASLRRGFGKIPGEGEDAGGKTGKRFGSGMKKWIAGEGGGLFKQIGENGGTVFGSGMLGAIKTPILGPAILGALGGAVAVAAPAAGAIAASGLVAGFGAGLAGLGIVFAAKSERVQQAWQKTMAQAGADVQLWSRPFEDTLVNISGYFDRTVSKFGPSLERSFAILAPVTDRFADRFLASTERLAPALEPLSRAFERVLDSLSPSIDRLFGNLATSLEKLSRSVEKGPDGLADMTDGISDLASGALGLVTTLNDVNTSFTTLTGGTSLVKVVMSGLNAILVPLQVTFSALGKAIDLTNAAVGRTGKDVDGAGKSMSDAAASTALLAKGIGDTAAAAQRGDPPMRTLAERMEANRRKAQEQAQAFETAVAAMFKMQNLSMGLAGAQLNLEASLDAASASLKENGRTLDVHTEKGRANRQSLIDVAQSANAQTEAMIRSGKSNVTTAATALQARANFVKLAQQFGATKPQAEAMAASMIAIPNVTREAKLVADKADLDTKLAAARHALADPKLTATKRARLEAEIAQLLEAKRRAQAEIDSLHGKNVSITLTTTERTIRTQTTQGGGHAPGHASGGLTQPRRRYLVGERGPEILEMGGQGGRIVNGEGPSGFGSPQAGPVYADIHVHVGDEVVRVVRTEIKADKRDLKRKVGPR